MGCDMYAFIDLDRDNAGDVVECFAQVTYLDRDYRLFALMAGVRYRTEEMGGVMPVAAPRGPPAPLLMDRRQPLLPGCGRAGARS